MQEDDIQSRPLHENLDTAYVNLAALLRYLRARSFVGRVHVELEEYEADVYLEGESAPRVHEINHAAGREAEGEAALQRLLVRAGEAGGQINVYETVDEESAKATATTDGESAAPAAEDGRGIEPEELGWPDLVRLSGDLIAAIERATLSFGADFNALFYAARLELADDFSFLDPSSTAFHYARGVVRLQAQPNVNAYISSISETLKRVVDRLDASQRGRSVRERVALELAVLARRRETAMKHFKLMPSLDRIAGTKVL